MKKLSLASLAVAALVAAPPLAQAQIIAGQGVGKFPVAPQPQREAPPPALPGAQTSDRGAPADKQAMDMPPTDALFDAINRGDIAAARDSISRGADLNGHNMLGMSPLELSVDLGRNNITFLLLSLRGSDGGPATPTKASATKGATIAEKKAPPPQRVARSTTRVATDREVAAAAPRAPKQFAGDGGAPVPSAGFLGFDKGAAAH